MFPYDADTALALQKERLARLRAESRADGMVRAARTSRSRSRTAERARRGFGRITDRITGREPRRRSAYTDAA